MLQKVFGNLRVAGQTVIIVAFLVGARALLWQLGIEGMSPTAVSSGIITAGVFVMGLVVAGTLADYREAEAPPPTSPPSFTPSYVRARTFTWSGASRTWPCYGGG